MSTSAHLVVRPGGLQDTALVEAMHARCSDLSLYRRFHAPLPRLSTRMVRQPIRPRDGWSLLGQIGADVVALVCASPISPAGATDAGTEVEIGLLVEDRHQRHGLGARLLHGAAVEAAARGYRDLKLLAQPDNDAVLATVRRAGLIGRVTCDDGLLRVTVPVHRLAGSGDMPRTA
jgi:GNAT superfamily N-acetyltransferase